MLGKPVIRGTRVTVELILRKLSEGATEAELLEAYPHLQREDIRAAIASDKDFGQLYRASSTGSTGVVLLRFPGTARKGVADAVAAAIERLGTRLERAFTVIQPGRIRIVDGGDQTP